MEDGKGLWLNLGCSNDLIKDFVNVDRVLPNELDRFKTQEWDLSKVPWPWQCSSVDFILAKDIIEHLPDKIATMNEIWRILKHGGIVHIEVPTTEGRGAFQDPTHVSFWNRNSFMYFTKGVPERERFAAAYGVCASFVVKRESQNVLADEVVKLTIDLEAIKK